jgi:hypothetical protein
MNLPIINSDTIAQMPGTSKSLLPTNTSEREPDITGTIETEPETVLDVTDISENKVYYEIEACLPKLKKQRIGSILLSSDGFIFKKKVKISYS